MKKLLALLLITNISAQAQNFTGADKRSAKRIKADIEYLAADKLEGRRTGSEGERLAYEFIERSFKDAGIAPLLADGKYVQPFEVQEGRAAQNSTIFQLDEVLLTLNRDYFPLAWSPNGEPVVGTLSYADSGFVKLIDLKDSIAAARTNPHFDMAAFLKNTVNTAAARGAKAVVFVNSGNIADDIAFDPKDRSAAAVIPAFYLKDKHFTENVDVAGGRQLIKLQSNIQNKVTTGHNVVGVINNNAKDYIVIGAHYDHLGYGLDHNSLYTGSPMIHNGADDNASGVAGMLELARYLKGSALRAHNYIFVAFSGEELGLYGSKFFVKNSPVPVSNFNFMVNLDMIGRLNPETKGLNIGGYGTSPFWAESLKDIDNSFSIKYDTSGVGPSDHTSFYYSDVPVLFFFTGAHSDYHKPTDDADKINLAGEISILNFIKQILIKANYENKIAFTKTREVATGKNTFKVSLGVMPDYTYNGAGVLIDGVTEGKAAQRAGLQKGDVLLQLGAFPFTDVQSYMNALNKFDKGESTTLKYKRGDQVMETPVTF